MRGACFLGKPNRSIFFILPNSGLQGGGKDPTSFLLDLCRFLPITKSHQVSHKKIPYLHVIKLVAIISYIKSINCPLQVFKCEVCFLVNFLSIHK